MPEKYDYEKSQDSDLAVEVNFATLTWESYNDDDDCGKFFTDFFSNLTLLMLTSIIMLNITKNHGWHTSDNQQSQIRSMIMSLLWFMKTILFNFVLKKLSCSLLHCTIYIVYKEFSCSMLHCTIYIHNIRNYLVICYTVQYKYSI